MPELTDEELQSLAIRWIARHQSPLGSSKWRPTRDDSRNHFRLRRDPESHWKLIQKILSLDDSLVTDQMLAAGNVENLLALHGPAMIDRIEEQARTSPRFAKLLGGVWKNRMTDEVWARVCAARDLMTWNCIHEGIDDD